MDQLNRILKDVIFSYATEGSNLKTYPVTSERDPTMYAVLVADTPLHKHPAGIVVMARIVNDLVVIEEDTTDRPLLDKLLERGIPHEKIISAHLGEPLPEAQASPETR